MKKTKFAVLFTALVSMLGLSSCLGEPDPYTTADGIFRAEGVVGYYKFKTAYGITVTPTNQNMITSDLGDFAYIYYKYDNRTVTQGTSNIDAELQQPPVPIKTVNSFIQQEGNAPLVSYQGNKEISLTRYLYDKNSLFVNLTYNVKVNKTDNSKNDLNNHNFYIFADSDTEGYTENDLVLRLSHVVSPGAEIENSEDLTYNDVRRIDLSYFMNSGKDYKRIIIKYQVEDNGSSSSEGDETIKLKDASEPYELNYEEFLRYFPEEE